MNGNLKFRRYFLLLPLMWLIINLVSGCQRKGVLRCPETGGKGSSVEVKAPNGQSVQATSVAYDKNGRVRKKGRLKFWQ